MRVSDVERSEVADALIRHFSEGRLTEEEYEERLERATSAKTRADLAPLLADLPPAAPPPAPPPRRRGLGRSALAVVLMLTLGWAVAGWVGWMFHATLPVVVVVLVLVALLRRSGRRRWRHHV
jgi:fatty acid desaturase